MESIEIVKARVRKPSGGQMRFNAFDVGGEGGGETVPGEDGGYYVPSVTQESGSKIVFRFAPSRDGMPVIPGTEVMLPKGDDGMTPVKGADYYTEADRQEMVAAVLAALPQYNGEVQ